LAHVQAILTDVNTALTAATASVNGGGTFGSVAAAENALRTAHLDVLNIFNDAASRILGGVNDDNKQIITDDMNAVISDLNALIQAQPMLFGGITGIHADTVMRQAQLEIAYINQAGINPDAG